MKPLPLRELGRILVVRSDHVGDLICSTPFLRTLHQAAPQAEMHALVAPLAAQALEGNPNVQRVFSDFTGDYSGYDLVVALSPRTRTYRLAARTRARYRAGYLYTERILNRVLCRWWLTHPVEISVRANMHAVPHEVEQHNQFAKALGMQATDLSLELPLTLEEQQFGAAYTDHVALHLSPGWLTRDWGLEGFLQLARAVAARYPLIITYGPLEQALVAGVHDLPLLGHLTLKQWAAVLGAARAVVSPDTGAVHIAAARKTPVVVVYQEDQFDLCSQQWSPWQVPHKNLRKSDPASTTALVMRGLEDLLESPRNSGQPT